jgi:hypothetical protein
LTTLTGVLLTTLLLTALTGLLIDAGPAAADHAGPPFLALLISTVVPVHSSFPHRTPGARSRDTFSA